MKDAITPNFTGRYERHKAKSYSDNELMKFLFRYDNPSSFLIPENTILPLTIVTVRRRPLGANSLFRCPAPHPST